MATINLDAVRNARREAAGEAPTVVFGGRSFALPAELPFDVVLDMSGVSEAQSASDMAAMAAAVGSVMKHLLGDEFDAFMALSPSLDDMTALLEGVMELYGTDEGNSPASGS